MAMCGPGVPGCVHQISCVSPGDSFVPNAKALEPVFKARMFASVEA